MDDDEMVANARSPPSKAKANRVGGAVFQNAAPAAPVGQTRNVQNHNDDEEPGSSFMITQN